MLFLLLSLKSDCSLRNCRRWNGSANDHSWEDFEGSIEVRNWGRVLSLFRCFSPCCSHKSELNNNYNNLASKCFYILWIDIVIFKCFVKWGRGGAKLLFFCSIYNCELSGRRVCHDSCSLIPWLCSNTSFNSKTFYCTLGSMVFWTDWYFSICTHRQRCNPSNVFSQFLYSYEVKICTFIWLCNHVFLLLGKTVLFFRFISKTYDIHSKFS